MFIESLKYGLHLHGNLCVHQLLMLHIIYMHISPFSSPAPLPPSALFISLLQQWTAVCFLILFAIIYICIFQLQQCCHTPCHKSRRECEGRKGAKGNGAVPRHGLANAKGKKLKLPEWICSCFGCRVRGGGKLRFINCTLLALAINKSYLTRYA